MNALPRPSRQRPAPPGDPNPAEDLQDGLGQEDSASRNDRDRPLSSSIARPARPTSGCPGSPRKNGRPRRASSGRKKGPGPGGLAEDGRPTSRSSRGPGRGRRRMRNRARRASFHIFKMSAIRFSSPGPDLVQELRPVERLFRFSVLQDDDRPRQGTVPDRRRGQSPFRGPRSIRLLRRGQELDAPLEAGLGDDPAGLETRLVARPHGAGPRPALRPDASPPPGCLRPFGGCSARIRSASARASSRILSTIFSRLIGPAYGSLMPLRSRTVARSPRTA